jgi:hypothetical protein
LRGEFLANIVVHLVSSTKGHGLCAPTSRE